MGGIPFGGTSPVSTHPLVGVVFLYIVGLKGNKMKVEIGTEIEFELRDMNTGGENTTPVKVHFGNDGITIQPAGTGVYEGEFAPILIERYDGKVKAHLWSDINNEDPTHSVLMDGALESARKGKGPCNICGSASCQANSHF